MQASPKASNRLPVPRNCRGSLLHNGLGSMVKNCLKAAPQVENRIRAYSQTLAREVVVAYGLPIKGIVSSHPGKEVMQAKQ
jgi:hypothetical protein